MSNSNNSNILGFDTCKPKIKALKGKNGYLFLTNDSNKIIPQITGKIKFSRKELLNWKLLLEMRHSWLEKRKIKYLYCIAPNKACIVPECLPDNITLSENRLICQFKKYLSENSFVEIVDPTEKLRQANTYRQTYNKGDTHWNFYGAYVASQFLISEVKKSLPVRELLESDIKISQEIATDPEEFDLGNKVGWENDTIYKIEFVDRSARCVFDNGVKVTGHLSIYENKNQNLPSAMVFGDSFGNIMTSYLAESFSRLVFVHQPNLDYELIEKEKPDIVISEQVERFLTKMPNDLSGKSNEEIASEKIAKNEIQKEIENCFKRLKRDTSNPNTYTKLGKLYESLNLPSKAINIYDKALELNPQPSNIFYRKGIVLQKNKSHLEAISCFVDEIKLNPNTAKCFLSIGISLEKLEKFDDAIIAYEKAIQLDSSSDKYQKHLDRLKKTVSGKHQVSSL